MNQQAARTGLILAFAGAVFVLFLWLTLPAAPAGFDWDDTWYLWMAEWYSGRTEFRDVAWVMMQSRQYPPLFPYLLSHTGEVLSGHAPGLVMNALFLAAGAAIALAWLIERGMPVLAAVAGCLVIVINPVSLTFIPTLMSEPLFILLTTAALALVSTGSVRWQTWLLIGLLAGLGVATRSAGWALVAGLIASLFVSGNRRGFRGFVPGLATGLLIHFLLKSGLPSAHGYLEGFAENLGNFNTAYVLGQGRALLAGWQELWGSTPGAIAMGLMVLPGLVMGLKQGRAEAWYVLVSVIMLVAWPFPGQMGRFLWVLAPALLALVPVSLSLVPNRHVMQPAFTALLALVLALSIPGGIWRTAERLHNSPGPGLNELSRLADWTRPTDRETARINLIVRKQLLEDADRIAGLTGNLQCIHSELPALVSIRARRVAYASPWSTLENFDTVSRQCRYYYLIPGALPGTDAETVQQFSEMHEELFRSAAPWDKSRDSALGVFYKLRGAESEGGAGSEKRAGSE